MSISSDDVECIPFHMPLTLANNPVNAWKPRVVDETLRRVVSERCMRVESLPLRYS